MNYNLDELTLTHDYNNIKSVNIENSVEKIDKKIEVIKNNVDKIKVINKHFSKTSKEIIDMDIKNKMDFGTYMHELFELVDLKEPDYKLLNEKDSNYVKKFLLHG